MAGPEDGERWPGIDELVEAYESAQARDGHADLDEFLPAPDHPQFLPALCELVRVDLEYGWQRGRPNHLEHYRGRFPDLFRDRDLVQEVAFEEYRLRRQAGEDPSPLEYRRRFGVNGLEWPSSALDGVLPDRGSTGWDARADVPFEEGEGQGVARAASAYRSYRLGRADDPADLEAAFASRQVPRGHADLFRDLHRSDPRAADRLARAVSALPRPGSDFLGFRLIGELGRGAFGRVYLASQGDLADRPVALKISASVAEESHALAQLQHTNIVPIHSVHRCGSLQAVCMPYLGATTLADVLAELKRHETLPDSGEGLLSSWNPRGRPADRPAEAGPAAEPPASTAPTDEGRPAVQVERLRGLGYVQAVLWLAARLADGLAHAHERGILHRDLKPANVLFSDDGEPLLLDFNMAADTKLRGHASAAMVGGTLPYMAPEHLGAFRGEGRPIDARSDVFSLGVILHELLTGRHPFPVPSGPVDEVLPGMIEDRQTPPSGMRRANRRVSPAVESIVRHCLEPDPARRYPTAFSLREDIQRHLDDLPLKHAPEPSIRERLGKWARRHPRLTSASGVGLLSACLLAVVIAGFLAGQGRLRRLEASDSSRALSDEVRQADFLLGSRDADPKQVEEGMALCRASLGRYRVLEDPSWASSRLVAPLAPEDRRRLLEDVGEVLFLWARAVSWRLEAEADPARRSAMASFALELNTLAEQGYGRADLPRALKFQKADLERLAGRADEAERLRAEAEAIPLRSPKERLLMISDRLDSSPRRDLFAFMRGATRGGPPGPDRLDTSDYATWLLLGNAYVRLSRPDEAASCYGIGISLRPDFYWAYFHRGLLSLEQKDYTRAVADFDRMIALRPDLTGASINRALAKLGLGDFRGAVDDLTHALESPDAPTRALFLRAMALDGLGDGEGAGRDRAEGIRRQPDDELSWIARGLARLPADPRGAVSDFDAALALNPRSHPALQDKASVLSEHLGRLEESIRVLDAAIEHRPDSVDSLAGRGVLLARLGRREAALRDALAALAVDDGAATLYQVAGLYAQTSRQVPGDRAESLRLMAAALRKDPSWLEVVPKDPDLAPVRDRPDFQELFRASAVVSRDEAPGHPPLPPDRR